MKSFKLTSERQKVNLHHWKCSNVQNKTGYNQFQRLSNVFWYCFTKTLLGSGLANENDNIIFNLGLNLKVFGGIDREFFLNSSL